MILTERVHWTLEKWPETRDNETLLQCTIWTDEMLDMHIRIKEHDTMLFMTLLMEGKVSKTSDIKATARKIQEEFPKLRGTRNVVAYS